MTKDPAGEDEQLGRNFAGFVCCYCGKSVSIDDAYGVWITPPEGDDKGQQWWCHRECYLNSLHEGFRDLDREYER